MGCVELNELPKVISIVGAGGKTTLLYALASRLAGQGKRVTVMTTTHIYEPSPEFYAETAEAAEKLWESGSFAVIGQRPSRPGKLTRPDEGLLKALSRKADHILVEADGAKHHPIKMPRDGEPVILPETQLVLAVMGLSAVGRPLGECCFGLKEAMQLLDADEDHILTAEDAAVLLSSESGGRKNVGNRQFCVVLNQCDDQNRIKTGEEIAFWLHLRGVQRVVFSAFDTSRQKFYSALSGADSYEA